MAVAPWLSEKIEVNGRDIGAETELCHHHLKHVGLRLAGSLGAGAVLRVIGGGGDIGVELAVPRNGAA